MKVEAYEQQFQSILDGSNTATPYDSEDFINYVKMNQARIKRWNKIGKLLPETAKAIQKIDQTMHWVLITEPWCGDAAHSHAFIDKLAKLNTNISLTVQNRDAANSEIDQYLTNGGKSIPKLIVRDAEGHDLFSWGPRPQAAQELAMRLKGDESMDMDDKKKALQAWYNKDKGRSIQEELTQLIIKSLKEIV